MLLARQLRRRPGRSAMLVLGVTVAVALLVGLQSLAAGFLAAQTQEIRDRAFDVLVQPMQTRGEQAGPQAAGVEDAHAFARQLAAIPGVASASPTLETALILRGEGNQSQVLAQGIVPADHLEGLTQAQRDAFDGYFTRADDERYANGTYEGPRSGEVVVNRALAQRAGLAKGDALRLAATPTDEPVAFTVVGVFETPHTGTGLYGGVQIALLHLSELQELTGEDARDAGTRVAVRLDDATRDDPAQTARVVAALRAAREGYEALTKEDELSAARERAAVSAGFYTAVAYVSLVVSALFVASVMVMEVQERRRDLGVLRAIGWSPASLFRVVAVEAMTFVGIGTVLGVTLGYFVSETLGEYFRAGYGLDVEFTSFTPTLAFASAVQALVVGIVAALYPAWRASRVDALDVIRSAR